MKKLIIFLALLVMLIAACAAPARLPSPAIVVDTGIDPDAWAAVPAGEFLMGRHMYRTDFDLDIEMMLTPVTNAQFAGYLTEALASGAVKLDGNNVVGYYPGDTFHGHEHEVEIAAGDWLHLALDDPNARIILDGDQFEVVPGYENHPAVLATWFGAKGYCEFYDWRLPTEAEWEKAARGEDGRAYPWGDEITEQQANYYNSEDPFEDGIGGLGDTTPVGFYNGGTHDGFQTVDAVSPYGLYDMAGNVWEWTADIQEGIHDRYLKGGSKMNYAYDLRAWTRNSARPDYTSVSSGFRCTRDVNP